MFLSLLSYYLNFGKYDFNVCTFLNWKVLRKEMSSYLNIICSAKLCVCILVMVCGFLCFLSHVHVCLWLYLYVAYPTLDITVLVLSVDTYSVMQFSILSILSCCKVYTKIKKLCVELTYATLN